MKDDSEKLLKRIDDMNINLKFYKNFVTIADSGTMSLASQKNNTNQTTLTMEIKMLEKALGTKLLVRNKGKRKLELTDVGKAFYKRSRDLCYLFNNIHEEMSALINGSAGLLRLSVSNTRVQDICRNVLIPFSIRNPNVQFEIIEEVLPKLEKNVLASLTELAIANSPLHNREQFEILHQLPEKVYAVFKPEKFSFPAKKFLSLKDLSGKPVALSKGSSTVFLNSMIASGYTINCLARCASRNTALTWAEAGVAIGIIPKDNYDAMLPDLEYRLINDNRFHTEKIVYKLAGKPLSPLAQKFLDFYLATYEEREQYILDKAQG